MSLETDIAAAAQRQLSCLAELGLAVADRLARVLQATDDPRAVARLADAFTKVSRSVRMSIALAMRLRQGQPITPRHARDPDHEDLLADLDDEDEDEFDDFNERPEGFERESLFDRLPPGDLPAQIAAIARTVASAARALPPDVARDYKARCEALAAGARRPLPLRPSPDAPAPDRSGLPHGMPAVPNRSRGPPAG